jgi:spoIIIJ-associated protein
MKKREFSDISLKDAILKAAEEFNTNEDNIRYEIITEKTRYFGHRQREIFINAWAYDGSEEEDLKSFLKEIIEHMKLALDFEIEDKKGFLKVNFRGDDYKLMLYQNGNLLNAVQYLLNRLFSDQVGKKIYCECENFRKNRERELTNLAHHYAKEVRKKGKSMNLKELNPFERRIVHMTINKYSDLESKSQGDSFLKVITIKRK